MERMHEERMKLLAYGPSASDSILPDVPHYKQLYIWGSKKGFECINTTPMALAELRAALTPGNYKTHSIIYTQGIANIIMEQSSSDV